MSLDWSNPVKATDHATVLKQVGQRLLADVTIITADNLKFTLDPDPPEEISHDLICTVSPMEGSFAQPELDGGGELTCIENTGVLVSIWARSVVDRVGEAKHLLFGLDDDKTRSLLRLKGFILKSLTGKMLYDPQDGQPILTEHISPIHAHVPRFANWERQSEAADISIGFATSFLWDLTS